MMQELNAGYWNQRYLENETGWDTGGITTPLKTYFAGLKNKDLKILIPGAGNAYEAEYLVNNGFSNVYVCDFAPEALRNLQKRCPGFDPAKLIQSDFFDLKEKQFDLIIEQTFFCALDPSLRRQYFIKMHELLKPGGILAGLLFDDKLNTDHPPFGGDRNEYQSYFRDLFQANTYETCYNSIQPRAGRELFIELEKKVI